MKKLIYITLFFFSILNYAQVKTNAVFLEFNYLYGNIIEHAPQLKPIIQSHPSAFIFSWNKKKIENSEFEQTYNFPDFGFSFSYQDFKTETLGEVFATYAHYNFYLTNRRAKNQVKLTSGFGLGYNTRPFDKETNNKNWAIGSHFLASVYLRALYSREYVIDRIGFNAGFALIHYSNASFNAPNLGINTLNTTIGINYNLDDAPEIPEKDLEKVSIKYPFKLNAAFRGGFSESLINGSGLYPFYTVSLFATKKLNYKSRISFGTDLFFSTFMKEYIIYDNIINGTPNETADWKRAGFFIGHELNMEHFSVITEIGVNTYYPYEYVSRVYERFGFRKRFSDHFFADLTLKINLFRAEGLEFGIGYQF